VHLTIARKLWLGFGTMLVLIGGIGYIGFDKANEGRHTAESLAHLVEATQAVGDASLGSARTRLAANRFAAEPSNENEANYNKSQESMTEAMKVLRDKADGLNLAASIDELQAHLDAYDKAADEFIVRTKERNEAFKNRVGPAGRELGQQIESLASDLTKAGEVGPAKSAFQSLANANELRLGVARFLITNDQVDYDSAVENASQAKEQLQAVITDSKSDGLKKDAQTALTQLATYLDAAKLVHESSRRAEYLRNEGMDVVGPKIAATVNSLRAELEKSATALEDAAIKSASQATTMLIVGSLIASVIGVFSAFLIARAVLKPLRTVIDRLRDIAEGEADLTKRVDEARKDELGELGRWFNVFVKNMQQILTDVRSASNQVAAAATEIAASSEEMARGMEQQSGQVTQIGSAVAEMSSSVIEVAKKSSQASEQATKAGQQATEGGSVVEQTVIGMQAINEAVSAGAVSVSELGKRGEQIGEIIKVINDIADQTNILALNAAVEAARAGEAGLGFAVVADEVRNLARRSADAAKETAEIIEESIEKSRAGSEISQQVAESLDLIVRQAREVDDIVGQISLASQEQSQGVGLINNSVNQLDTVTQSNAAAAEQSASASEELRSQASLLHEMVADLRSMVTGKEASREKATALTHQAFFFETGSSGSAKPKKSAPAPLGAANRLPLTPPKDKSRVDPADEFVDDE